MAAKSIPLTLSVFALGFASFFLIYSLHYIDINKNFLSKAVYFQPLHDMLRSTCLNPSYDDLYGWRPTGYTYEEQLRLQDFSIMIAAWPSYAEDHVSTVPCLSDDGHLLVLSVAASRIRYGTSITFMMVYPNDVQNVLPKNISTNPVSAHS